MRELVLLLVFVIVFILVACTNHATSEPDREAFGEYQVEEVQPETEASGESSVEEMQPETEASAESSAEETLPETEAQEENSYSENETDTEDDPAREKTPGLGEYIRITASQAKEMMDANQEFVLLDVRTPEEFTEGHIEGAILIPYAEIAARAATELTEKDMLILIYCRSGRRSEEAARTIIELGYTNVYDFGGIIDWPYNLID